MENTISLRKTSDDATDYKAAIDQMIRKMEQSDKRIERLRQDTERVKAETREILARLEGK